MMKFAAEGPNPELFDFVPRTFLFPQEQAEFSEYQASTSNATFIAKPCEGAQGDGMVLFTDLKNAPDKGKSKMIVQRYIADPLLLNGFKFDLRVFVVVTGMNDGGMHAFLADEGLARFCTEQY